MANKYLDTRYNLSIYLSKKEVNVNVMLCYFELPLNGPKNCYNNVIRVLK